MCVVASTLWRAAERLHGLCAHINNEDVVFACHNELVGVVVEEEGCKWGFEFHGLKRCAFMHEGDVNASHMRTFLDVPQLNFALTEAHSCECGCIVV